MMHSLFHIKLVVLYSIITVTSLSCAQAEQSSPHDVQSFFEGTLKIQPDIDPSTDYRGFEVLVARDKEGEPDTLGYASTDSTGNFSMRVSAPSRGVYRLVISRFNQIQTTGLIAIAEGDSAMMVASFPLRGQNIRIRSEENASLHAYQNIRVQHDKALVQLVQSEAYDDQKVLNQVMQTTMILWNLQQTFPNSMGSELAAAEAIAIGGGWQDSLTVARMRQLPSSNPRYGEIARIARKSEARLRGQSATIAFLEELAERADTEIQRAEIASERIISHMDSMEYNLALTHARIMQEEFEDTQWSIWAERTIYEIQNLLPGMEAPAFTVRDVQGNSISLEDFRGKYIILEFYQPEDEIFQREIPGRNDLIHTLGDERVGIVSISMQPDTLVNEAFFEERDLIGHHVYVGGNLSEIYNINLLPTRYLIDPDGTLVNKYIGGAMAAIYEYMITLLD